MNYQVKIKQTRIGDQVVFFGKSVRVKYKAKSKYTRIGDQTTLRNESLMSNDESQKCVWVNYLEKNLTIPNWKLKKSFLGVNDWSIMFGRTTK